MSVRVGFASIDGAYVDQHFGRAHFWQIYDISEDAEFIETRKTKPSCGGHCEGGFQEQLDVLEDCDVVIVSHIGMSAAAAVIAAGKRVYEAVGPLDGIAEQLIRSGLTAETDGGSQG